MNSKKILQYLNEADDFEYEIGTIFDNLTPDKEYGGYEIDGSGICIKLGNDGICFYASPNKNIVFQNIDGSSSFDIQAPKFLKDKEGNEYGDTIYFDNYEGDIKELFNKLNATKKEYDENNKDAEGYATIIECDKIEVLEADENRYGKTEPNDPVLDKTIKIYDINALIDEEVNKDSDDKYESFDFGQGAAILIKSDGSGCIADYEGVGSTFNSTSDKYTLYLNKKSEDKDGKITISIVPTASIDVTVDELLKAPSKEMKVRDFFNKYNYNDRCARNFDNVKPYLEECDKLEESSIYGFKDYSDEDLFFSEANTHALDLLEGLKKYYTKFVEAVKDDEYAFQGVEDIDALNKVPELLSEAIKNVHIAGGWDEDDYASERGE